LSECEMTQADMFFPDVQIVHNINLGFKLLPSDLQQVDGFLQVLRFSPPILSDVNDLINGPMIFPIL
jgi:hypothetical protein